MFKIYSVIYCATLVLFMIFFLVASFLVGAAGHSPAQDASVYGVFAYLITTICCLIIYRERHSSILKYINIILVLIPALCSLYVIFEMLRNNGFVIFIFICILLFNLLSALLIHSIFKN